MHIQTRPIATSDRPAPPESPKRSAPDLMFSSRENQPDRPKPKKRLLNWGQRVGFALLGFGALLGIGQATQADIKYDGHHNWVASDAEEKYQMEKATIPGTLVMGAGAMTVMLSTPDKKKRGKSPTS